jgi:hypothetical protein
MELMTVVEVDMPEGTLRLTEPSSTILPDAIPALRNVAISPTVIAPGESLGERESVTIDVDDLQYPYDGTQWDVGTLWGKIKARYPTLRGRAVRVYRGALADTLDGLQPRYYVLESLDGPTDDGVRIVAKDFLKHLDSDRAAAPEASRGRLLSGIDDVDTELTLTPTGVGDAFYRSAGIATIGGREIVEYTRSGDTVTLVQRSLHNTVATSHEADATFQEALEFNTGSGFELDETEFNAVGLYTPVGESFHGGLACEIIAYLMVRFAGVSAGQIPLEDWYVESTRAYTGLIAQPEGVKKLIDELVQQAGFAVWPDVVTQQMRLRSLINVTGSTVFSSERVLEGTYSAKDQQSKQVTESWIYWGRINPLKNIDDKDNYRAIQVNIAADEYPEEFDDETAKTIRTVTARWIQSQSNAEFLGRLTLARYATPPRMFSFATHRSDPGTLPQLGARCFVENWALQDEDGLEVQVPAQVISIAPDWDSYKVRAEELGTRPLAGLTERTVYIDEDSLHVNFRELHDLTYAEPQYGDEVLIVVSSGIVVGGDTTAPSADVGDWPEGVTLTLWIQSNAAIRGLGGDGGEGGAIFPEFPESDFAATAGGNGGTALYTRYPIAVRNDGVIAGGAGGGGANTQFNAQGAGGGGGAGYLPGDGGGSGGTNATQTEGGDGGPNGGGDGGDPGQDGADGLGFSNTAGGDAGPAVDGESFVTYDTEGTIFGARIN